MDMIARIGGKARPTEFEPDVIVINVWGEMLLAMVYFEGSSVTQSGDGWDVLFENLDIRSFPYREITEESLPAVLSEHPAEVTIVGTVSPDEDAADGDEDGEFEWEDAGEMTEILFMDGGAEVARCPSCRFVMHCRRRRRKR